MSEHAWRPSVAFVLAAGMGTRMRHLTSDVPKPMVPLLGVPLIDRVLDRIAAVGIDQAVVNVHYKADALEAHLAHRTRPRIHISDERDALLNTGGGVMRAWPLLGEAPFLIQNSDSVWTETTQCNLAALCDAFAPDRMDCLMLLADLKTSIGYDGDGDFACSADGGLDRRRPGQSVPFVFAGASLVHPRLFDGAPSGAFSLNTVWDRAIARRRLFGISLQGVWMHVGTPEAVAQAEAQMGHDGAD